MKKGILYINLGTPEAPTPEKVKAYLQEFLMDPFVIDIPSPLRFLLVHGIIGPFRSKRSAKLYESIWTNRGSPLRVISDDFIEKLRVELGPTFHVELAMRYGAPTIKSAVKNLLDAGVHEIQVFTAYPQYALSSTETAFEQVRDEIKQLNEKVQVKKIESYPDDSGFIGSVAHSVTRAAEDFEPDFYLFSYHGLPIRHVKKISAQCSGTGPCSLSDTSWNQRCYRRQCYKTTEALVAALKLRPEQYAVGFQSRLSQNWIQPFSDDHYRELPKKGVKRLLVVAPSFTADCLETLEEIAIRGREEFKLHGGDELELVPCVNSSELWVQAVRDMIHEPSLWQAL